MALDYSGPDRQTNVDGFSVSAGDTRQMGGHPVSGQMTGPVGPGQRGVGLAPQRAPGSVPLHETWNGANGDRQPSAPSSFAQQGGFHYTPQQMG